MQEPRRWTNQSQPQTLQIAVFLLYADAVFAVIYVLSGVLDPVYSLPVAAGGVAAGFGVANEKKWGYWLGLVVPALSVLSFFVDNKLGVGLIGLMFDVALVALLLHTQSREYQRIWFK